MSDPWEEDTTPSASRRAYEYVKERILDGTFPGTDLLSEGEIAAETGMSRTPVRAAFVQLEAEGLLRLYPKRGAIVTPVMPQEAASVIEARWVIERHAIERADTAAGRELAGLAGDDVAFHRALVARTGNAILLSLYDSLRDRQRRVEGAGAGRSSQTADEHRELAGALEAGATEQALRLLRRQLDSALAVLRGLNRPVPRDYDTASLR